MKASLLLLRKLDLLKKKVKYSFPQKFKHVVSFRYYWYVILICKIISFESSYNTWYYFFERYQTKRREMHFKCRITSFVVIKPVSTSFVIHIRTRPTISSRCFEYEFDVLWSKIWYRNNSYFSIESVFTLSSPCKKKRTRTISILIFRKNHNWYIFVFVIF